MRCLFGGDSGWWMVEGGKGRGAYEDEREKADGAGSKEGGVGGAEGAQCEEVCLLACY